MPLLIFFAMDVWAKEHPAEWKAIVESFGDKQPTWRELLDGICRSPHELGVEFTQWQ
jgi:hypothetical protein